MKRFLGTIVIAVGALAVACGSGAAEPAPSAPIVAQQAKIAAMPSERQQADAYQSEVARLVQANKAILATLAATTAPDAYEAQIAQVKANDAALRDLVPPNCLFVTHKLVVAASRGIDDGVYWTLTGMRDWLPDRRRGELEMGRDLLTRADGQLDKAIQQIRTAPCL
jgi:hypothetical protein